MFIFNLVEKKNWLTPVGKNIRLQLGDLLFDDGQIISTRDNLEKPKSSWGPGGPYVLYPLELFLVFYHRSEILLRLKTFYGHERSL